MVASRLVISVSKAICCSRITRVFINSALLWVVRRGIPRVARRVAAAPARCGASAVLISTEIYFSDGTWLYAEPSILAPRVPRDVHSLWSLRRAVLCGVASHHTQQAIPLGVRASLHCRLVWRASLYNESLESPGVTFLGDSIFASLLGTTDGCKKARAVRML